MFELRPAQVHDLQELREVAISSYQDTFSEHNTPENMMAYFDRVYSPQALEKDLNEPGSMLMVAVEDDHIIGFVRLRESDEVSDMLGNNTIELQRLYVLTSAQGKSVGSKLMEEAFRYAGEKKYKWMWLGVWEHNYKAQAFYEKWGFEKFSEHTFWMGDDPQVDWLLRKKL